MNLLEFDLQDLIPKVQAQGADSVAQPTFGTLETGGGGTNLATLTLTASSTATGVGGTFTVDVEIATGDFNINEYRLIINFDPARLSVVDANPAQAGNQIEFLDSVFDVAPEDNFVEAGKITLIARTLSGNALQVNRTVARITFQAQTLGTSTIEPVSGIQGTQLLNQNGIAIPLTLNSVTVVLREGGGTTTVSPTTTITSSLSSATNTSSTPVSPGPGGDLPATGLSDGDWLPLVVGFILIVLGVNLSKHLKPQRNERR